MSALAASTAARHSSTSLKYACACTCTCQRLPRPTRPSPRLSKRESSTSTPRQARLVLLERTPSGTTAPHNPPPPPPQRGGWDALTPPTASTDARKRENEDSDLLGDFWTDLVALPSSSSTTTTARSSSPSAASRPDAHAPSSSKTTSSAQNSDLDEEFLRSFVDADVHGALPSNSETAARREEEEDLAELLRVAANPWGPMTKEEGVSPTSVVAERGESPLPLLAKKKTPRIDDPALPIDHTKPKSRTRPRPPRETFYARTAATPGQQLPFQLEMMPPSLVSPLPALEANTPATDADVERFQRLLDLSKSSDEKLYLSSLERAGTPLERQGKGLTVTRASGSWLTSTASSSTGSRADTTGRAKGKDGEGDKKVARGGGGAGGTVVAEFRTEGGYEVTEEEGFKFESGMVLRITESDPSSEFDESPTANATATTSSSRRSSQAPPDEKWHVQGTLLEVRKDRLIIAFEEGDWWPLEADENYQIDIGLDVGSYALQEEALQKVYFDPAQQRQRNMLEVLAVQEAFVAASESADQIDTAGAGTGTKSQIREWTLQGTELREEIVPSTATLDAVSESISSPAAAEKTPPLRPIESDLFRDNQLINSWIERYRRDDPLVLPGDPDLGLNASQTKAIAMALGDRLSLIQGPPGTGKSQTIVSLIALLKLHFRVPHPILLAAPTHVSVDHLVSILVRAGLNPLRCGKAHRVSPEVRNWTIEKRQEEHPLWKATEAARLASEEARQKLQEFRDEMRGTKEAETPAVIKKDGELVETFRKSWRTFIIREQKLYSSLLATADVFCATAVGSGASKVLNMVDFPIVLLDEAAMCTEPVSLIPLMKGAQHATLIGDHKQLPAVVTSKEARQERLHTSLFERLLHSGTVNSTLLDTQYRMRPAISSFPNSSFYHGALLDADAVLDRPPPLKSRFLIPQQSLSSNESPAKLDSPIPTEANHASFPVSFIAHWSPEASYRQSLLNRGESDLLITIVGDLLASNPDLSPSEIGIISPYYAQMRLVSNSFSSGFASARLGSVLDADRAASVVDVEVNTVDGFQGREKRVILLSTVRSNSGGWIGFLNDKRRLNVALTRARDALIVVGNEETLRRAAARSSAAVSSISRSEFLRSLTDNEYEQGDIVHAPTVLDPDADPQIWADFLDWCRQRGVVQRWTPSTS
ncbi:hypothetical protein JCM10908_003238 [Rhodotorula pacifica]|uniref:uncharacterized protein n=1 Tax=Rhodotorula pacifica TaxID=1495444 RepID=UPI003173FAD5